MREADYQEGKKRTAAGITAREKLCGGPFADSCLRRNDEGSGRNDKGSGRNNGESGRDDRGSGRDNGESGRDDQQVRTKSKRTSRHDNKSRGARRNDNRRDLFQRRRGLKFFVSCPASRIRARQRASRSIPAFFTRHGGLDEKGRLHFGGTARFLPGARFSRPGEA